MTTPAYSGSAAKSIAVYTLQFTAIIALRMCSTLASEYGISSFDSFFSRPPITPWLGEVTIIGFLVQLDQADVLEPHERCIAAL